MLFITVKVGCKFDKRRVEKGGIHHAHRVGGGGGKPQLLHEFGVGIHQLTFGTKDTVVVNFVSIIVAIYLCMMVCGTNYITECEMQASVNIIVAIDECVSLVF